MTTIGSTIKKLRQEKNITQERLAEHLNISAPAVSKWERGETYPDIGMIVPLASYFGVTTDTLLGFDAFENQQKIDRYLHDYWDLLLAGKWDEGGTLICAAHKEFPNDFPIMHCYMQNIIGGSADNPAELVLAHAVELRILCERVLAECTIDYIRDGAIDILAKIHKAEGNVPKALELLDRFPGWYGSTKGQKSEQLFDKNTPEWWHWLHRNIFDLANFTTDKIQKVIWYTDKKTFEEKVSATLRLADYLKNICTEANYEPGYSFIQQAYSKIAGEYNARDDFENVYKYLAMSFDYAIKFDAFIDSDRQISHTDQTIKRNFSYHSQPYNLVKIKFTWLDGTQFYKKFRESDYYPRLKAKYQAFAKDYK